MTAREQTQQLSRNALARFAVIISFEDANTLRRAERTLHTWGEQECGDSNDYNSWSIERDETTGKPYRCVYPHTGEMRRYRIADREAGALRRVAEICKRNNLHFFHQTDPRGCSLYVSCEAINDTNYTRGMACCA